MVGVRVRYATRKESEMFTLYYVPIASYKERYSEWLSRPDGVFEQMCNSFGQVHSDFQWVAIRPKVAHKLYSIKNGVALDPVVMCEYGFAQTTELVKLIMSDHINAKDAIYIEDFWHPGMEMILYALSFKKLVGKVKLYAHVHGQTIDVNDFTYKLMNDWMPAFEAAWAAQLTRIFSYSTVNRDMIDDAASPDWGGWPTSLNSIDIVGSSFNSNVIQEHFPPTYGKAHIVCNTLSSNRSKVVVYSSRLDSEKDPMLFLEIAAKVILERDDISFVISSSADELRSNDPEVLTEIARMQKDYPKNFRVFTKLTKKDYYGFLATAAVQINTALQDYVSMTLLEATSFGCTPFYPSDNYSFGEAMGFSSTLLYARSKVDDAVNRLIQLVDWSSQRTTYKTNEADNPFGFIYQKYNLSIDRALLSMYADYKGSKKKLTRNGINILLEKAFAQSKVGAKAFDKQFKIDIGTGK